MEGSTVPPALCPSIRWRILSARTIYCGNLGVDQDLAWLSAPRASSELPLGCWLYLTGIGKRATLEPGSRDHFGTVGVKRYPVYYCELTLYRITLV